MFVSQSRSGGYGGYEQQTTTMEYNGSTWSIVGNLNCGRGRTGGSKAGTTSNGLVFGGQTFNISKLACTEEWDYNTEVFSINTPSGKSCLIGSSTGSFTGEFNSTTTSSFNYGNTFRGYNSIKSCLDVSGSVNFSHTSESSARVWETTTNNAFCRLGDGLAYGTQNAGVVGLGFGDENVNNNVYNYNGYSYSVAQNTFPKQYYGVGSTGTQDAGLAVGGRFYSNQHCDTFETDGVARFDRDWETFS